MVVPTKVLNRIRTLSMGDFMVNYRGWNQELMEVKYRYFPTVSEIASLCPTHRDVFLSKVQGLKPLENKNVVYGRLLHEAFLMPLRLVIENKRRRSLIDLLYAGKQRLMRKIPSEIRAYAEKVYDVACSLALNWAHEEYQIPILVEPTIDATNIGLSDSLKPDLVIGLIPCEFTIMSEKCFKRKEIALAAYALAIESMTQNPVNYGILASIRIGGRVKVRWRLVPLTDQLRRMVIEERDKVARIVEYGDDPGISPSCSDFCLWREVCLESYNH
ncbi:MAG: type I-A CRISPR-associated protein Cas4/Csa1 [Thermoprotei archaeon]|nr:MAG: type I-A CRISPR-associated protein Cas4/Csa1 [Thermoprotei archaeon]